MSWRDLGIRLALASVLIGAYFVAWRPVRVWLAHHAMGPALEFVAAAQDTGVSVSTAERIVAVQGPAGSPSARMFAPAGASFLGPGAVLLFLFPWRPYWLYLWAYQMGLGVLLLGLLALFVGGMPGVLPGYRLLSGPFYLGTSLAAPFLAYWMEAETAEVE